MDGVPITTRQRETRSKGGSRKGYVKRRATNAVRRFRARKASLTGMSRGDCIGSSNAFPASRGFAAFTPLSVQQRLSYAALLLENDSYPVSLNPDHPAVADHAIICGHEPKAIWNVGCVSDIDGCAFRRDVQHSTTSTRPAAGDVSGLINLRSWMFSSFVAEPVRMALSNATAIGLRLFFQINSHFVPCGYL
jgi:hypothetical protein